MPLARIYPGGAPREQLPALADGYQQLLATGQFVEAIFSCHTCGLSGTTISRPQLLEDRRCDNCGAPVFLTTL